MTSGCSINLLESSLAGSLPASDQAALDRHLDECEACGEALERMAGWASWCEEAASLLTEDELDELRPTREDWAVDFTVEHLDPTDEPGALGRLGDFDVLEIIGHGGMGVVLKAHDRKLNRRVAIKILSPHLAQNSLARKRFAREAQAAAAVVHPHVLAIHQVQPNGSLPFLVMPFVAGESLAERLTARGTLELTEILRIGMQAAAGLGAAHEQGLVHRDVKPANILLEKGIERAVLTDFGLARAADDVTLTRWGIIAGTPQYMSPEQARGEPLDGRSDLFSLGCVLYEMATGVSPFRSDSLMATMRRLVDDQPRAMEALNPELPPWFIATVDRLLEKDPSRRFSSAKEVSELLEECLAHVQQPATAPLPAGLPVPRSVAETAPGTLRLRVNRRLGVIVGLLLMAFGGFGAFMMLTAEPQDRGGSRSQATQSAPEHETAIPNTKSPTPPPEVNSAQLRRVHHFRLGMVGHDIRIASSPDGKLFAVANGNPTMIMGTRRSRVADNWEPSVKLRDARSGKAIASLILADGEENTIVTSTEEVSYFEPTALAFSPDGKTIAVGTSIGQVKLFNAKDGELIRSFDDAAGKALDKKTPENWKSLKRAMGSIAALAFSPDGKTLATCGRSFDDFSETFERLSRSGLRRTGPGRLKLWNVQHGTLKHDLVGHNDFVTAVAFSPNGKLLASAGRWMDEGDLFGNGVLIWNPQSGEQIHSLIRSSADGGVQAVAFSPDSKLLVMGTQRFGESESNTGDVSVVEASSGTEKWLVTVPGRAKPVALWRGGKTIAVLYGGRSIRFLDAVTGATTQTVRQDASSEDLRWEDFAIASKSRVLMIGGVDKKKNGYVELWKTANQDVTNAPTAAPDEDTPQPNLEEDSDNGASSVLTIVVPIGVAGSDKDPALGFGAMVERTVQDISTGHDFCLNLESGELLTPPATVKGEEQLSKWARENEVDLAADLTEDPKLTHPYRPALTTFDLFYVGPASWDGSSAIDVIKATPFVESQLAKTLSEKDGLRINHIVASKESENTLYIRTRRGRTGLLQITGFNVDPSGVKIRYKLVNNPPRKGWDEAPWGWKQAGIQVRLQPARRSWKEGEDCKFKIAMRNTGTRELTTSGIASLALEVDGKAFPPRNWMLRGLTARLPFGPGKKYEFDISLSSFGSDKTGAPKLTPGKHSITAILLDNSIEPATLVQSIDRKTQGALAVSNPVEVEVEPNRQ
jgi:serine/threonine protein kinase/WD40 repeat protein